MIREEEQRGGFECHFEEDARVIKLRVWGLWSPAIGAKIGEHLPQLMASARQGGPWMMLIDQDGYTAQGEEVQDIIEHMMRFAITNGCIGAASVSGDAFNRLQISRLTRQSALDSMHEFFPDEVSARAWLKARWTASHSEGEQPATG